MVSSLRRYVFAGILLSVAFPSQAEEQAAGSPTPAKSPARFKLPPVETVDNPTPAEKRYGEVWSETKRLVKEQDRAGLTTLAGQLRQSQERMDSGAWLLESFYQSLSQLPDDDVTSAARVQFFRDWSRDEPSNITAQVALAEVLTHYAWDATDNPELSEKEENKLYDARMAEAWQVLEKARDLAEKCPGWAGAAQSVGLGETWDTHRYMKLVNEAVKAEPTYGGYYTNASYFLAPKWHGEAGDYEKWIDGLLSSYPAAERDRIYAFFVWMAHRFNSQDEISFASQRLDWDRTKHGFKQWLKSEPHNLVIRTEFIQLALLADDRMAARDQFDAIGGRYWPDGWDDIEDFKLARVYAYRDGRNPVLKAPPKKSSSSSKYSPATLDRARLIIRLGMGFIGGCLGGLLLLLIARRHQEQWAGVAALGASVVLATALGTWACLLPAIGLFFYLRSRGRSWPPEIAPTSGWLILLWVVLLAGSYLLISTLATMPAGLPELLQYGRSRAMEELFKNGTALRIAISADVIVLLAMIALCPPAPARSWIERFGLRFPARPLAAIGWTLLTIALIIASGYVADQFIDDYTRQSVRLMATAINSPISFYIALAVGAPIFEELLFRGYAYSGWINKLGPWWTALATAALFAVAHLQYGVAGLLHVFFLGFLLALLRWRTSSIYPCIFVHFANNLANCLIVQFWPETLR